MMHNLSLDDLKRFTEECIRYRSILKAHGVEFIEVHDSCRINWDNADMQALRVSLPADSFIRSRIKAQLFVASYGTAHIPKGAQPFITVNRKSRRAQRAKTRRQWNELRRIILHALPGLSEDELLKSLKKIRGTINKGTEK